MAKAMMGGIIESGLCSPQDITATARSDDGLKTAGEAFKIKTTTDNAKAASTADIVILAVKPNVLFDVIAQIKDSIRNDTLIISIAAGRSNEEIEGAFGKDIHLIRTMPNTPALVGEGMSALSPNSNVTDDELEVAKKIFSSFGKCEVVAESLMDAVVAVSGSSPAYVYMFIEAMADAAVLEGMPRKAAYTFAAQSVLGAAKMVLHTGKHPGELKDAVCSPAGTTIEAVAALERGGFRGLVMDSMHECAEKNRLL